MTIITIESAEKLLNKLLKKQEETLKEIGELRKEIKEVVKQQKIEAINLQIDQLESERIELTESRKQIAFGNIFKREDHDKKKIDLEQIHKRITEIIEEQSKLHIEKISIKYN